MKKTKNNHQNVNSKQKIESLERELKELKEVVLAPKKEVMDDYFGVGLFESVSERMNFPFSSFRRTISLEEKVDLIIKHLKINFVITPPKEEEVKLLVMKKEKTSYETKRRLPRTATEAVLKDRAYKRATTSKKGTRKT